MRLEDYQEWKEVISKDEFREMFASLMANKALYDWATFLEILDILSEKYAKFYGTLKLTEEENEILYSLLVEYTDFSNIEVMDSLTAILFKFTFHRYYWYLKRHLPSINHEIVKNEVWESLLEYEKLHVGKLNESSSECNR